MSELNLLACPICQAQNSLSRETMDRAGKPFTWYQCQECGSVLLWLDDDCWAYQKIGREDQAHLLKQPLTAVELHYLVKVPDGPLAAPELQDLAGLPDDVPDEPLAAPESQDLAGLPDDVPDEPLAVPESQDLTGLPDDVPDEPLAVPESQDLAGVPDDVPDEPLAAPAPSVLAVPTEEPDTAPDPPAPVPERKRKGPSRWLLIALAVIGLCFVLAVVGLLVANQFGF